MINRFTKVLISIFILSVLLGCDTGELEELSNVESELFELINRYRAGKDLKPFVINEDLTFESRRRSENMGRNIVGFNHNGLDERARRINSEIGRGQVQECIAKEQITANEVLTFWITNLRYKPIIEGQYTLGGLGVYRNESGINYFTLTVLNFQ